MSCEVYYYSGAYNPKLKRELNCDQLFSVYHEKRLIIDTIQYKQEHPEYTAKIMCDSGAFTHFQNMKKKGEVLTDEAIYNWIASPTVRNDVINLNILGNFIYIIMGFLGNFIRYIKIIEFIFK